MALALSLCRLVQFTAALLLWGGLLFRAGLCPAGLQAASAARLRRWLPLLAALNLAAALAWLGIEAGLLGDGIADALNPEVLLPLILHTHLGQILSLHALLSALLLAASFTERRWLLAALAGAALASLALIGHAAMRPGLAGLLHQASAALHLLAAGFWLGGLVALLPCLRLLHHPALGPEAQTALRRYSLIGHGAVALVFASGALNATLILTAQAPFQPGAAYLSLLALKLACVVAMVGLALLNRYLWVPRLSHMPEARRWIEGGTYAEITLAAAALALVSVFASLSPYA